MCFSAKDLDCSQCGCLEPDPDIAGIGSFTVTSVGLLLFSIVAILVDVIARKKGSVDTYAVFPDSEPRNRGAVRRIRAWTIHLFFPHDLFSGRHPTYHYPCNNDGCGVPWLVHNTQILAFVFSIIASNPTPPTMPPEPPTSYLTSDLTSSAHQSIFEPFYYSNGLTETN